MPPEMLGLVVTCVGLAVASIAQRVVGIGFGLIMAPLVSVVASPVAAVLVVNAFAALSCAIMIPRVWRTVEWRRLTWLLVPAAVASVAGLFLARLADADVLRILVGIVAIAGVVVSLVFTRTEHTLDGPATRIVAGVTIGLGNAAVGLGAPQVAIYSVVSRWRGPSFATTMLPFWCILSVVTLAQKQLIAPGGAPEWPAWGWLVAAVATVGGSLAAESVARVVPQAAARIAVIVMSLAAGALVIVTGTLGVLA